MRLCLQHFLEQHEFKSAEACKAEGMVTRPDGIVEIWRKQGRPAGKPVLYHAMEGCPAKTDATWRRVVAVFVQGKKWQFKGWPFAVRLLFPFTMHTAWYSVTNVQNDSLVRFPLTGLSVTA